MQVAGMYQTKVVGDTLHPVWNEMHVLEGVGKFFQQSPLVVAVYDYDSTTDNIIGSVSIDLKELKPNVRVDKFHALHNEDGEEVGRVRIKIRLIPAEKKEITAADRVFNKMRASEGNAKHNLLNALALALARIEIVESVTLASHRSRPCDTRSSPAPQCAAPAEGTQCAAPARLHLICFHLF